MEKLDLKLFTFLQDKLWISLMQPKDISSKENNWSLSEVDNMELGQAETGQQKALIFRVLKLLLLKASKESIEVI